MVPTGGDHMTTTPGAAPSTRQRTTSSTEELARRQGVRPIKSVEDLAAAEDPVESDEEYEAFLADLYASRRAGLA